MWDFDTPFEIKAPERSNPPTREELILELAQVEESLEYFQQRRKEIYAEIYNIDLGDLSAVSIKGLRLSTQCYMALRCGGVDTVADALKLLSYGDDVRKIPAIRNFGPTRFNELKSALRKNGYKIVEADTP